MPTPPTLSPAGEVLRTWRSRRGMSQLAVSAATGISARHLSCVETGRAQPSRELLTTLGRALDLPAGALAALFTAAGFARTEADEGAPDLGHDGAQAVVDVHTTAPALVMAADWTLVAANAVLHRVLDVLVAPHLLAPPVSLLRLTLDPQGLAPHLENLPELLSALVRRVQRQVDRSPSAGLSAWLADASAAAGQGAVDERGVDQHGAGDVVLPVSVRTPAGVLHLVSTTSVLALPGEGSPRSWVLEVFHPRDSAAAAVLSALTGRASPTGP